MYPMLQYKTLAQVLRIPFLPLFTKSAWKGHSANFASVREFTPRKFAVRS